MGKLCKTCLRPKGCLATDLNLFAFNLLPCLYEEFLENVFVGRIESFVDVLSVEVDLLPSHCKFSENVLVCLCK